jgi:small conductance mechanosensitive channel
LKDPPTRVGIESVETDGYKVKINIWVKAHGFQDTRMAFQEKLIRQFKDSPLKLPGME